MKTISDKIRNSFCIIFLYYYCMDKKLKEKSLKSIL